MAIKKRPQTPLSSCTWIVQDPLHREVNARTDCYPCQMGSAKSLYTMTAQCLDLFDKLYSGVDFVCKTFKYHGQSDPALPPDIRRTVTLLAVLMMGTACRGLVRKSFNYPVIQCKRHRFARWKFRTDQADQPARQILPLPLSLGDPVVIAVPYTMKINRQQRLCNAPISREHAAE